MPATLACKLSSKDSLELTWAKGGSIKIDPDPNCVWYTGYGDGDALIGFRTSTGLLSLRDTILWIYLRKTASSYIITDSRIEQILESVPEFMSPADVPDGAVMVLATTEAMFDELRCLYFVQEHAVMEPRQLCSKLLHNCLVGPRQGEGAHVLEVAS